MRWRGLLPVVVVAALNAGSAAAAHPEYESSSPPDGGQVEAPPPEVSITFTEPPSSGSSLTVTDPCGRRADEGSPVIEDNVMSVTLRSADVAGAYTARYAVVSTLDGHPVRGSFSFSAAGSATCTGAAQGKTGEAAGEPDEERARSQVPGPLPWGTFGVALLISSLVGAAAGKIYAGIVGLSSTR